MDILLRPDHIYLGGGNSARVDLKLDKHVSIGSNDAGLEGGAFVWKTDRQSAAGKPVPASKSGTPVSAGRSVKSSTVKSSATKATGTKPATKATRKSSKAKN